MPAYHVSRSTVIHADADKVFDTVADFGTWTTWSPWLCAEPEAEVVVSDDPSSVGSTYAWRGEVVGQGEMEHEVLQRGTRIESQIRFIKPFKSVAQVSFDFEPSGEGTSVTWHMNGKMPFFLFWMIPMMKSFIGMDYQRGLLMLKEWLETGTIHSETKIVGRQKVGPLRMLGVRKKCEYDDIGKSMEQALQEAVSLLTKAGISTEACDVISVYHHFDIKRQIFDYSIGYVVETLPESPPAGLSSWEIGEMDAFAVDHIGAYEHLGNAWSAAHQHVRYKKMKPAKCGGFELYGNDPAETDPADLLTHVYIPIRS